MERPNTIRASPAFARPTGIASDQTLLVPTISTTNNYNSLENNNNDDDNENNVPLQELPTHAPSHVSNVATGDNNIGIESAVASQPSATVVNADVDSSDSTVNSNQKVKRYNPGNWLSWKLSKRFLAFVCFLVVGIIAGLITVIVLSHKNNGFVDIQSLRKDAVYENGGLRIQYDSFSYYSLTWIALPALVFIILRYIASACISDLVDRAPREEIGLTYPGVATLTPSNRKWVSLRRSVLLDYKSHFILVAISIAIFRNKHHTVGIGMTLDVLMQFAVTPLSAAMFYPDSVDVARNTTVIITQDFDNAALSTDFSFSGHLRRVQSIAEGASLPAWTTTDRAYVPYNLPDSDSNTFGSYRAQAATRAYSAHLKHCEPLSVIPELSEEDTPGPLLTYDISDRGCIFVLPVRLQDNALVTYQTFTQSCPLDAGRSRLIAVSGLFEREEPFLLKNHTIMSCIPVYESNTGTLSVLFNGSSTTQSPELGDFVNVQLVSNLGEDSSLGADIERSLTVPTSFEGSTNPLNANDFGRVSYEIAKKLSPLSPLDAAVAEQALNTTFKITFATLASSTLLQPLRSSSGETMLPRKIDALIIKSVLRLKVNTIIAVILASIHFALIVLLILILVHVRKYKWAGNSERSGILTETEMTMGPHALDVITGFRESNMYGEKSLKEYMDRKYDLAESLAGFNDEGQLEFSLCERQKTITKRDRIAKFFGEFSVIKAWFR